MAKFKFKLDFEDEPVIRTKTDNIDDLDKLMKKIKVKFGGKK